MAGRRALPLVVNCTASSLVARMIWTHQRKSRATPMDGALAAMAHEPWQHHVSSASARTPPKCKSRVRLLRALIGWTSDALGALVCAHRYVQWGRLVCSHGHTLEYAGVIMSAGDRFVSTGDREPKGILYVEKAMVCACLC